MARKRSSLSRADSSAVSTASSSSVGSCINVASTRKTRSDSVDSAASPISTPPTSLPEESISDVASTKQALAAEPAAQHGDTTPARRSARRKSAPITKESTALSSVRRAASATTLKGKTDRCFSGATLVDNDASEPVTGTSQRKLLDDGVKALDLDWDMDSIPVGAASSASPAKKQRRNSTHVDRLVRGATAMVDKVKSGLGKRKRETDDSTATIGRRQSRRLVTVEQDKLDRVQKAAKDAGEDAAERPSKMARLASTLHLPSLSSSMSLSKTKPRQRPVKKYQSHGLYAGQSADSEKQKPSTKSASNSTSTLQTAVLPAPMFNYPPKEPQSFKLPFDVFAPAYRERGEEKPKDWGKVNKNRFAADAKDHWRSTKLTPSLCMCPVPEPGELGCVEGVCLNRSMHYECDDNLCGLGDQCGNRDFAKLAARMERASRSDKKSFRHLYNAGVEVIKTNGRGFGVRAVRSFQPGEIITEYIGEIITPREAGRRIREDYAGKPDYYQMEFDQGMILDATKGSIARFVNHCCEPNCNMEKRFVAGQPRMALFAGQDGILTGEELTYDYNFDAYNAKNVQICLCGAANCRGVLGPRPKDGKKPSSQAEKDNYSAGLKRKAAEDSESAAEQLRALLSKKRKVKQFSKGWVYVDEDMEAARQEEAALDREIARLQRQVDLAPAKELTKASISTAKDKKGTKKVIAKFEEKVKTKMTSQKSKKDDIPKEVKRTSMLGRLSGSLRRTNEEVRLSAKEKRKSSASLRQSTLSFHRVDSTGSGDQKGLLDRPATSASLRRSMSNAKNSLMSRRGSTKVKPVSDEGAKRNSTLRVVEGDDE
ncbi:hypothetical protein MBLNU459_g4014t1 [Dothideomycetes sp. NU459]